MKPEKRAQEFISGIPVIRSGRKTLAVEIGKQGLLVRAPFSVSEKEVSVFLEKNDEWIREHLRKREQIEKQIDQVDKLQPDEIKMLVAKAKKVIPERVAYYAALAGVTYGRITIRNQKTRWGSCSAKGNLNFNCLLMLTPLNVIDSVVVHELCHRKEMNHSARFYDEVLRVFPEYRKWNRWLKEHGSEIMSRME